MNKIFFFFHEKHQTYNILIPGNKTKTFVAQLFILFVPQQAS